ncbi:MAG: hypothetical protein V4478_02100 [Patescibacteria group bacterium]
MHARKKLWIKIGSIALIALVGFGVGYYLRYVRFQSPIVFLPATQTAISNNERAVGYEANVMPVDKLKEVAGGAPTSALGYEDALIQYRGRVVQFNQNCRAYPVIMTIPPKTVVMLDNQSRWDRTITIGARTYTIAAYDYVLASFNMNGQYPVSCDSVQNVGIVSVQ